jgi:hypothetical protein
MKTRALVVILMMLCWGCGYNSKAPDAALLKNVLPTEMNGLDRNRMSPELRTNPDILVKGVDGWIDLMPGIGYVGGPHTRVLVKFTAISRGCTTADDFRAKLTEVENYQVLTVYRTKPDPCGYDAKPIDLVLSLYGTYRPATPVLVNGVELPTDERIIY